MARRMLLDTNHLGELLRPDASIRKRFDKSRGSGVQFGCCNPVPCELESLVRSPKRQLNYRSGLRRFLGHISIWPLDLAAARLYGEAFRELRAKGRALSQVDIMLVALARQMDLTILTSDRDFDALDDVKTENWLA